MVNGAFVCLFLRLDWGKNCVLRKNYVSQEKTISLDSWAVIRPSQRIVRTLTHRGHSHAHTQYVNTLSHGGSTWWAGEKPNVSTAVRAMSTARTKHRRKLQTCQVMVLLTQRQGAVATKKSLASSELLFNSFTFLYLCWSPLGSHCYWRRCKPREKRQLQRVLSPGTALFTTFPLSFSSPIARSVLLHSQKQARSPATAFSSKC